MVGALLYVEFIVYSHSFVMVVFLLMSVLFSIVAMMFAWLFYDYSSMPFL